MFKPMISMCLALLLCVAGDLRGEEPSQEDGWQKIFNGENLEGWKANESGGKFTVEDGAIVGHGGRCHLYYMEQLENFELKIDVKINEQGNSGLYFHAPWVDEGWPVEGFEMQINTSHRDPVKTGSLYGIIKIFESPAAADTWFTYHLKVVGNTLTVSVDDKVLYTYVQPKAMKNSGEKFIGQGGMIALQQHDPGSVPEFKNVYLKKLPADAK
jgi:hypothetical protein